jgi:triacylglycerol esterase/lipase EstA (alpha/beta hydrolase family)
MNFSSKRSTHALVDWIVLGVLAMAMPLLASAQKVPAPKPTIVLVHGAFAGSSNWNGVIQRLHAKGYTMVAAENDRFWPKSAGQSCQ